MEFISANKNNLNAVYIWFKSIFCACNTPLNEERVEEGSVYVCAFTR